jgi:hypothetical protein
MRVVVAVVIAVGLGLSGCDPGATECSCPLTGLTVTIPPALTGDVIVVTPSGQACAGAKVTCTSDSASCATYHVDPTSAGPCHLDIDFSSGTVFSDDLTVVSTTGCCAGLRASPSSAGDIDVPAPLVDAGHAGDAGDVADD